MLKDSELGAKVTSASIKLDHTHIQTCIIRSPDPLQTILAYTEPFRLDTYVGHCFMKNTLI